MTPLIKTISPKLLIGINRQMSLAQNETGPLWRQFMPRRGEIMNRVTTRYLSMQVYFDDGEPIFSPATVFTKWAAVEVSDHDKLPSGMEPYLLNGGLYAAFLHRGPASSAPKIMQSIFAEWLPNSGYQLDNREHFEILDEGYDPLDANAQETICIPLRR